MAEHITETIGRLRQRLREVRDHVAALEPPALLHRLQEIEASGQRSREDDGGPLTELMERQWRIRSAAYHAAQLAELLRDVPAPPASEQFRSLGSVEWVDPIGRDHAYLGARVWPGQDTIMLFLSTDQDGDLDLMLEPEAMGRVIAFLKDVRDRAIEQADAKER